MPATICRSRLGVLAAALLLLPTTPAAADMTNSNWSLVRFDNRAVPTRLGAAATLSFDRGQRVSGTIVCKGVGTSARWHADGRFSDLTGPRIITPDPCPGRADAERIATWFWDRMSIASGWRLIDDRLVIGFADGSQALLVRLP